MKSDRSVISVAEKSPQLIAEWDESNEIPPEKLSYGSNKKVCQNIDEAEKSELWKH